MFRPQCLTLVVAAAALSVWGAAEARACSCAPKPTVLDDYERAPAVVLVRAEAVERAGPPRPGVEGPLRYRDIASTRTVVEKVYKGALRPGDAMTFAQGGGADCIWTFTEDDVGQRFLIYAHPFEGGRRWVASTCGRSRPVDFARDDLLYLDNLAHARGRTRLSGTFRFFDGRQYEVAPGRKMRIAGAGKAYEARTDDRGVYEFYDLPAGRYKVEVETPQGWLALTYSNRDRRVLDSDLANTHVEVTARRHAYLDVTFRASNAVSGRVLDPSGRPLDDVCVHLHPAEGPKPANLYETDCSEAGGRFRIEEIPPGRYVIVVNDDGEVTGDEPFGTFYYPNARRREEAAVFDIGPGVFVEGLEIYAPVSAETVTVEGVFLYADGRPVGDELVQFYAGREGGMDEPATTARTDARGRFTFKLLRGAEGRLRGEMHAYAGKFENCAHLDRLVARGGKTFRNFETPPVTIRADADVKGVELRYPFDGCKEKQNRGR